MRCRSASCFTTKSGEEHYNLISALHKSVRNSDPDAALYWLGRMLEAGEDPLYVARRVVRMAVEDIGLADPNALSLCMAARDAVDFIGMPEGNLALAQAVVYLSVAPKSNALYTAYGDVQHDIEQTAAESVPLHLRNAPTSLMKGLGYGKDYQYAHDVEGKVANMQCLPENLRNRNLLPARPNEGIEKRIRERMEEIKRLRPRTSCRPSSPKDRVLAFLSSIQISLRLKACSMATTGVNVYDEFSAARPALDSQVDSLQKLQKAAQKISSILDLDQLIDNIVNDVAHSFGLLETAIYLHDEARGEMVMGGVHGCSIHSKGFRLKIGREGMVGYVASTGQMRYAPDVRKDEYYIACEQSTHSEVAIPLQVGERLVGVFTASHPDLDAFPRQQLRLLQALCDHVAVAFTTRAGFSRSGRSAKP